MQLDGARTNTGATAVRGRIALPDQTKLWVDIGKAKADATVLGGTFTAADFGDELRPLQGLQRVRIEALFNGAWQPASVLAAVGDGAKKLRGDCAKKTDPDVTDSNIEISCSKSVVLPPLSAEQRAILAVRNAVLTVPGQGRSHGTINETVTLYLTPGAGLRVRGGWSAKLIDGVYEVVFDFSPDGPAIWAFNPKTGTVKYINHVAKLMSYLVAD